jgi:hypothetical protein
MAVVTIHFCPESRRVDVLRASITQSTFEFAEVVMDLVHEYTPSQPVAYSESGSKAAEEAFDLTNNPMRGEESFRFYPNQRPVCVGDLVEVVEADGYKETFLCLNVGWEKI